MSLTKKAALDFLRRNHGRMFSTVQHTNGRVWEPGIRQLTAVSAAIFKFDESEFRWLVGMEVTELSNESVTIRYPEEWGNRTVTYSLVLDSRAAVNALLV